MKHPSVRELALEALNRIDQQQAYSNLLLNQLLLRNPLSDVDARLLTEIVYGTVQRRNTIDYYLAQFVTRGLARLKPWVLNLLRLSFYQIYYLDRIPAHAIVNEAVMIARRKGKGNKGITGLINGVLRTIIRSKDQLVLPSDLQIVERIALTHSYPEWLITRWLAQFGEPLTEDICAANNKPPHISARVNLMKMSREHCVQQLHAQQIDAVPSPLAPSGVIIKDAEHAAIRTLFDEGILSIQDESSMVVAHIVDPQPGMKVLDCCAAPGGKTVHMAEMMNDTGEVWANDIHTHKQNLIEQQAERLGLNSIRTTLGDAMHIDRALEGQQFDRILVDAPCSGLGVIRRKPDLKWQKQQEEIAQLPVIQLGILTAAARLLQHDGVLVYSTCTLLPEENEQVVTAFLAQHPEFMLADDDLTHQLPDQLERIQLQTGMFRILPHQYHSDGFFMARLKRRPHL